MRKEENLELIKQLAETKVDTSLFHSSRKLGTTTESKRDVLSQAYREYEAGINTTDNEPFVLYSSQSSNHFASKEDLSDNRRGGSSAEFLPHALGTEAGLTKPTEPQGDASAFGSGLKRPLESGDDGRPVIKKRQRVMRSDPQVIILNGHQRHAEASESEWEGFPESDRSDEDEASVELSDDDLEETWSSAEEGSEDDDASPGGISGFKAWATQQRNTALGFTPSAGSTVEVPKLPQDIHFEPRPLEIDPLPPELQMSPNEISRKVHSVHVERPSKIQEARLALPVVAEEQKIMEAIHNNDVVIIWGATGSGKTTQVPQFLFEAGYADRSGPTPGLIGVTQPRRVAAVSMAERVGNELGTLKRKVAYQVHLLLTV